MVNVWRCRWAKGSGGPRTARTSAMIAGVLVLLVAVGGGYALGSSGHLLITVCVHKHGGGLYVGRCARGDKKLQWNKLGPQGQPGNTGAQGDPGPAGPFPSTLPPGKTITGTYALGGGAMDNFAEAAISWPYRLASPPAVHVILAGQSAPAGCSGSPSAPGATSGNLCIFEVDNASAKGLGACDVESAHCTDTGGIGTNQSLELGVFIRAFELGTPGNFGDEGTWAVTG
jgi:hypothetical protein